MRNKTFLILAGSYIGAEQHVMLDERTRRVVPTEDLALAIGRAISSVHVGDFAEISPVLRLSEAESLEPQATELAARISRLAALERKHGGRFN